MSAWPERVRLRQLAGSGVLIFTATTLPGVELIDVEPHADERGFFARTWCRNEFAERRLNVAWAQCSVSYNRRRGTLRGMHYQRPPYAETKLVRCTRGAIYDVVADVRADSPTLGCWSAFELSSDNRRALYIPAGFAHGFLTLTDDAEVFYQISDFHRPEAAAGFRWNDPAFGIEWPAPASVISSRDEHYPDFES